MFIWICAAVPQPKHSIKSPVLTKHTSPILSHHSYVLVASFLLQCQQLYNICITSRVFLPPYKLNRKRVPRNCRPTVSKLLPQFSHSKSRTRKGHFCAWIVLLSSLTSVVTQSWHLKTRRLSKTPTMPSWAKHPSSIKPQHCFTGQSQTLAFLQQPPQCPLSTVFARATHHANIPNTLPTLASQ